MLQQKRQWITYVIPPVLVALVSGVKDVFGLYLPPEDPIVWINALIHASSYIGSELISIQLLKMGKTIFFKDMAELVVQPGIHGLISGSIVSVAHTRETLRELAPFQANRMGSFYDNFIDGFMTHVIAYHLATPFDDWIQG